MRGILRAGRVPHTVLRHDSPRGPGGCSRSCSREQVGAVSQQRRSPQSALGGGGRVMSGHGNAVLAAATRRPDVRAAAGSTERAARHKGGLLL